MLLYNKALDPYHTLFRLLNVLNGTSKGKIEHDRLRIYDFLLAFPVHVSRITLPRELQKQKNPFKKFKNSYNVFDAYFLFESMKSIQNSVIDNLIISKILQKIPNSSSYVILKENYSPELFALTEIEVRQEIKDVIAFINNVLADQELYGQNGLKASSHLMEYKYDSISSNIKN
ncbi:hypothetical protein DBR44_17755 [Aquitalea sp. FJL05]|uniref:ABC-three component system middle component 5 n=1 Tax=Aquitalea TaxID=407217 RepID=UPI000FC1B1BB|nr:hypothetical protein DBR44_17755 [Aquitalea sp. FJL05]